LKAFILGIEEIIPRELINILNENELGLILSGLPTVDSKIKIDYLKKSKIYS
jgi:hypothetical protein